MVYNDSLMQYVHMFEIYNVHFRNVTFIRKYLHSIPVKRCENVGLFIVKNRQVFVTNKFAVIQNFKSEQCYSSPITVD